MCPKGELPVPWGPLVNMQMYFVYMPACKRKTYMLVMVDSYSKWIEVFPGSNTFLQLSSNVSALQNVSDCWVCGLLPDSAETMPLLAIPLGAYEILMWTKAGNLTESLIG
jgi:hypothetical protein